MKIQLTSITLSAALLSACAQTTPEMETPGIEAIDAQIEAAVTTTANANQAIAEVEVATSRPAAAAASRVPENVVLPPDAVQPVTVDWQGGLEPFLEQMASRAGYTFRTSGQKPANEVVVNITANEEPLFGVVRRAGNMARGHADIAFNPTAKVIEIRYGG
ncbi:MAG: DotD/TraH family lipoprotein [Roseibium sp.]|uniref:DotD/TraH family lipoprotein n=1 Tax=Roseibium sp. TaxID=1936156 RepID=UPI003297F4E0